MAGSPRPCICRSSQPADRSVQEGWLTIRSRVALCRCLELLSSRYTRSGHRRVARDGARTGRHGEPTWAARTLRGLCATRITRQRHRTTVAAKAVEGDRFGNMLHVRCNMLHQEGSGFVPIGRGGASFRTDRRWNGSGPARRSSSVPGCSAQDRVRPLRRQEPRVMAGRPLGS